MDSIICADLETLHHKMREMPFEDGTLALSLLKPSDKVLVSGLSEYTSEALLKYGMSEHAGEIGSVKAVEKFSPTQAVVTFKSHESM